MDTRHSQRALPHGAVRRAALAIFCASITLAAGSSTPAGPPPPLPPADLDCAADCPRPLLACGASVAASLAEGDCTAPAGGARRPYDIYALDVAELSNVRIRVEADGFEPDVRLFTPAGGLFPCGLIAKGEDRCDPGNPKVSCIETGLGASRENNRFLVLVTSAGEATGGSYRISLDCRKIPCTPSCSAGTLGCGATVSGMMAPAASAS